MDWDALRRSEFPVTERWAYFDHAAVAPLPRRSGDMLRAWAVEQERHGVVNWPDWERKLEATRGRIARLLNAEADEIAFVGSTTQGIGLVAEGFPCHGSHTLDGRCRSHRNDPSRSLGVVSAGGAAAWRDRADVTVSIGVQMSTTMMSAPSSATRTQWLRP